jgi:hypothetical protein
MLEWEGGMDALAQQYARVDVEDSHGCNASWPIEGRGVGAESESSHLHGWSECEESAVEMGAAAAAAVWIRARMIGCAAAWIGILGQVSSAARRCAAEASGREDGEAQPLRLLWSRSNHGRLLLVAWWQKVRGEKYIYKILVLTLWTLRLPISPLTEWLGLFLRRWKGLLIAVYICWRRPMQYGGSEEKITE